MAERPILFSAPMVRALLAGTKTQTRRVAKLNAAGRVARGGRNWHADDPAAVCASPYGGPGDSLWVRETVGLSAQLPVSAWQAVCADRFAPDGWLAYRADDPAGRWCWRPSIHMPRWASRITLRVTGVRVERMWDISEADSAAEGIPISLEGTVTQEFGAGRRMYRKLWESINGAGSWVANPPVWVVSFASPQEPKP
jgi:hypothetical protein